MSDLGVLSHEYRTASQFSQAINQALITLKKVYYNLPGADTVTIEEEEESRRQLADIFTKLVSALDPARRIDSSLTSGATIPASLVAKLRSDRQGDLAYFLDDLEQTSRRVKQGLTRFTPADIVLMDQVAALADAETSKVFRRLTRK